MLSNTRFLSYQKDTLLLLSCQEYSAVPATQPTTFDYNSKETKRSLDIQDKKDLARLIFKWIKIDNFKIVDYELYEPFKSYLEGKEEGGDRWQLEEIQIVPRKRSQSCISRLLDVR